MESLQPALIAAVDCGLLFVFFLLTSGYLSAVISFTSLCSHLFHTFLFVYSRKDVSEHRALCLVYMSLIGENVTSCNIKMYWISVLSARQSLFLEVASGCCFAAVDDAQSRKGTQYQNSTLKTVGRLCEHCAKVQNWGFFVLLWTVSCCNGFLNCF